MSTPEERLTILSAETQRLEQYLGSLQLEAREHPSACELWTVADVVAHLTVISKNTAPRIIRALQGDASPDMPAHSRLATGQMDPAETGDRAIALSQELGDQLFSEFIKSSQALSQSLAKVGPQDWDKLVYRQVGTEPLRNIVDIFITELTVHGWDIRSRFEPEAGLSPECVPIIVQRIAQRPRWWSFSLEPGFSPLPLRCRFEVTTPIRYSADVVVTDKEQYMEVGSRENSQVTFRTDGETYVMVMYGRVKFDEAIASGRVSVGGGERVAREFIQRFTGG